MSSNTALSDFGNAVADAASAPDRAQLSELAWRRIRRGATELHTGSVPGDGSAVTVVVAVADRPVDAERLIVLLDDAIRGVDTLVVDPAPQPAPVSADQLIAGELRLDTARMEAYVGGRRVSLARQELLLLRAFMEHPGHLLSREQLLDQAWGFEDWGAGRTVDVHVRRLRIKLASEAWRIVTLRGFGYRFESGDQPAS